MRLIALILFSILGGHSVFAAEVVVSTVAELEAAVRRPEPGDVIVLAPGLYEPNAIRLRASGTPNAPITVRAEKLGTVRIQGQRPIVFRVMGSHWHFENLDFFGPCPVDQHNRCEHAFQIVGDADGIHIRSSRMVNFNAAIKGNGQASNDGRLYPDDAVISNVIIYNLEPRQTRNPVTAIDIVGGRNWKVVDNFVADYGRVSGNPTYLAFLKGNSKNGLIARNVAICQWRHRTPGRVGLSLGGGGTSAGLCEDDNCDIEHENGRVTANIVANCPTEPGLYLNAAAQSDISGNMFFRTTGVQMHTAFASATFNGNIFNGGVRDRLGSTHTASHNEIYGFKVATFLPAVSSYIQRRLEGQDKKYPSLISPGMVDGVQSIVAGFFDFFTWSPLGLGYAGMSDLVLDAENLDVTLKSPDEFVAEGLAYAEDETDFCGRSRKGDTTIGPFIASEAPCSVRDRIQKVLDLEREFPLP